MDVAQRPVATAPSERPRAAWRLPVAIGLVSAGALAYQLLLMRWLAIAHWYPFAAMIISLALLGHGASGTWLALWLRNGAARLDRRFAGVFALCAALFALAAALVPALAARVPFNGLELVWNPRQLGWLTLIYLLLAVPFFFAAACFGLAFVRHGERIPQLYGADLVGAGAGALAATCLAWLPVGRGMLLAAACGALAAMLVAASRRALLASAVLALALAWLPGSVLAPQPNEYKGFSKALQVPGARVLARHDGPYGSLAVLDSPRIPLRHAPGLSLGATVEPPPQLGLYTDGDALSVIVHGGARRAQPWLRASTSALPYALQAPRSVLVLSAGGGMEVVQALAHGVARVDAVDLDPQRLRWLQRDFAGYSGGLYADPRVRTIAAEPRAHVRATRARYDLIVLAGGDSFASSGAGAQAASEQYALTVEAMRDYLGALTPRGMLVVTRWSKQPPRDELRLFATAITALRGSGATTPGAQLAAIRNWDASTWLVAARPLTRGQADRAAAFADAHGFDPVHLPGLQPDAVTRFHVVEPPTLFAGTRALLSPRARAFIDDYKFAIAPARDDRPYFAHSFRWRSLPELWRLRGQGSAVLLDSGYLLLVAALAQAVPVALLLVLVPLWFLPRRGGSLRPVSRMRAGAYFLALGLAFLLIEIATLSRLTLLVGHPVVAAGVGLAGFLVCVGAGSLAAQRWLSRRLRDDGAIAARTRLAMHAIVLGVLWQWLAFALAWHAGAAWPVWMRALCGLLGIAPLAFAMGMPFALGLSRLARAAPAFVPWAWGLNGCASVVAAIAAVLLAMTFGLLATMLVAVALYAFAIRAWPAGDGATARREPRRAGASTDGPRFAG